MDQLLSRITLKDGSPADLHLVMPPEPCWADDVHCFLKHKGMPWQIHWQWAFQGMCDDLQTRFYLLTSKGEPISNIMTCETDGIGILGHVYTKPAWRGRGAASILMNVVREDFIRRDGVALYLGTAYDSLPWRLYEKFGFEGFLPNTGMMRWVRQPDRLRARLSGCVLESRPLRWSDWPLLQCLFLQPADDYVRNMGLKRFGPSDMEGPFLTLQERMQKMPDQRSAVISNEHGMTVGLGTAMPLDAHLSDYLLVDLFAHRGAEAGLAGLLQALQLPADKPLLAVVEESASARLQVLESAGFVSAGCLPGALNTDRSKENLVLMMRTA